MAPRDDPSPTGDLAAARTALENEDLAGAVRHVASALGEDPNRSEALTLLDEVLAASDDPLQLFPDDDLPASSGMKPPARSRSTQRRCRWGPMESRRRSPCALAGFPSSSRFAMGRTSNSSNNPGKSATTTER